MSDKIRVIVFKRGEHWLAQGLEHDICAQATSLDKLFARFDLTVSLESELDGGLERIKPAPEQFFDMWDQRQSKVSPVNSDADSTFDYGLAA